MILIWVVSGIGISTAALPGGSANAIENTSYWIHLNPVPDQHLNDTFVITGTTNIPIGELIEVSTYLGFSPHTTKYKKSVFWGREYIVTVLGGSSWENTFTTPPIQITPSESGGTYEEIWVDKDYIIIAYYKMDPSVEIGTSYEILASESPPVTPTLVLQEDRHQSTGVPVTPSQKSPISPALAIVTLGITGIYVVFTRL